MLQVAAEVETEAEDEVLVATGEEVADLEEVTGAMMEAETVVDIEEEAATEVRIVAKNTFVMCDCQFTSLFLLIQAPCICLPTLV